MILNVAVRKHDCRKHRKRRHSGASYTALLIRRFLYCRCPARLAQHTYETVSAVTIEPALPSTFCAAAPAKNILKMPEMPVSHVRIVLCCVGFIVSCEAMDPPNQAICRNMTIPGHFLRISVQGSPPITNILLNHRRGRRKLSCTD
jgi:hypothetical protein